MHFFKVEMMNAEQFKIIEREQEKKFLKIFLYITNVLQGKILSHVKGACLCFPL